MAGDESKPKKPRKPKASSDRASEKLADTRVLLEEQEAKSADAIAFVHAVLCQIGLPRSPQKDRVWTHTNGKASLTVLAGGVTRHGKREEQPLPQGPYARLILADISTYAVRHKTPLVPMEDSATAYMRNRLHLFPGGGKRGTYTSFKREALALAAAHMELAVDYNDVHEELKAPPIKAFRAWTHDREAPQTTLWPGELWLAHDFFESLQAHAAPIDMRAYRALAHSALAQDIYTWLAHRLPRLKAPLLLPWTTLAAQFGGYADVKRFRKEFIKRLGEVHAVYPDAQLEVMRGRRDQFGGSLQLKPSKPPIYPVASVVPGSLGAPAQVEPVPQEWQPQDARRRIDAGGKPIRERLSRKTKLSTPEQDQPLALVEEDRARGEEPRDDDKSNRSVSTDELLSRERCELQQRLRLLGEESPERLPILERVRQIDRERLRMRMETKPPSE